MDKYLRSYTICNQTFSVTATVAKMDKFWLSSVVWAFLLCNYITVVDSSHFRGAVVMVRPKVGGAAKEVTM